MTIEILKFRELTWIEKYYYVKMCWSTIHSELSMPLSIFDRVLWGGILLKLFGVSAITPLVLAGIGITLVMVYVGHLKLKHKIASTEISIGNRYNPELMTIYKKNEDR